MAWLSCGDEQEAHENGEDTESTTKSSADNTTITTPTTTTTTTTAVAIPSDNNTPPTSTTATTSSHKDNHNEKSKESSSSSASTHATSSIPSTSNTVMCRKLTFRRAGMASEEAARCEDKATSTDDELLASPQTEKTPPSGIAAVAQLWGADLVGLDRPRHLKPHRRALHHQESLSSASDVSRAKPPHRIRKQRTVESCDPENRTKGRSKEIRRQWTTDSSDSGYSKGYSRERLKRQDTEDSVESSKRFIKDLQRQPTTESSSSLRLTRQSSLRSGSDNQSLYLMRQSTIETYDEFSTTDFSRPQSCNSAPHAGSSGAPPTIHIESPHCSRDEPVIDEVPAESISYIPAEEPPVVEEVVEETFTALPTVPSTVGAPLLMSTSCSLINLSAIELEASQINEIQKGLICISRLQKIHARRKKRRREIAKQAAKVCRNRSRARPTRNKDDLPKGVRWSIMATGLVLFLMSIILVGATLRMAPLIDEMGE